MNPMSAEIREWAYTPGALEPEQDWDLALANLREFDLYVHLAADDACPSWDYFLRILYLIIGDAVRTEFQTESKEAILEILDATRSFPNDRFSLLRKRAELLIASPDTFNYDDWCAGALVTRDLHETTKSPIIHQ